MSGSSASPATISQSLQEWIKMAGAHRDRPFSSAPSVADQRVFQSKLLFLELVKKHIIGMGTMLFGIDFRGKRGMFGCDSLFLGMVHWSISFRWLTQDACE